jgi:hypothetical protein
MQIPSLMRHGPDREIAVDAAMDVVLHRWSPEPL